MPDNILNNLKIIGLNGKPGSGKTTVANYLRNNHNFYKLSFAAPIKQAIISMLPDNLLVYSFEENREKVIPELETTVRILQATLGTDWGRVLINKDIWIIIAKIHMEQAIKQKIYDGIVFDDVRFDNEVSFITSSPGVIWKVHRNEDGLRNVDQSHASEAGIDENAISASLYNTGDFNRLYKEVDVCLENMK